MNIKMLVLDENVVSLFSYAKISGIWFDRYEIPESLSGKIKRIEVDDYVYFLSDEADEDTRLLFINICENGLFDQLQDKRRTSVFNRILVMAMHKFGHSITPTNAWRKYTGSNYISICSGCKDGAEETRLLFQKNPSDTLHVYMFDYVTDGRRNLDAYDVDEDSFIDAFDKYTIALDASPVVSTEESVGENFGIELTESMSKYYGGNHTIQHWYDNILTSEQRAFVDKGYSAPVRLKGAAGTGKTLALSAKILKDSYSFEELGEKKNLLFITHSAVNSQLVLEIIHSMDNLNLYASFKFVNLKIVSLYDLAQDLLNYNLKSLAPLSTDGREGRQLQYEIFESILNSALKNVYFVKGVLSKCSERFRRSISNLENRRRFILNVLNEFACILDAENIYLGSKLADKYLTGARESWLMDLEGEYERRVILELHERYKEELKSMDVLSMDQMVADFNRYLLSHEWNHIRSTNGYDAVFVDELHCFTKPERMIFHELFKENNLNTSDKIPLFMAYDINQSTDDRFLYSISPNNPANLVKSTKVGKTELVELTRAFRYTPNISRFLKHIDGSFPALDLASEWCTSSELENKNEQGDIPELRIYENNQMLVDKVFGEADRLAAKSPHKNVAVLCVNTELFDSYSNNLGRIKGKFIKLSSRDDLLKTQRGRHKCIFSMPDYVAGLQFDIVYLIHLDKNELDEDNSHSGEYRRFIAQVYLGASRAKEKLIIASSKERRGAAQLLNSAISDGSLKHTF